MTMYNHLLPSPRRAFALAGRLTEWLATAAAYYTAATTFEQLRGLSDAELRRRGLSRATLAWDICQAQGQSHQPK